MITLIEAEKKISQNAPLRNQAKIIHISSLHCPVGLTQGSHARKQRYTREGRSEIVFMQRSHDYEYRKIPRNLQKSYYN